MIDLAAPMHGRGCSALPFREEHRAALKAACAEDQSIWPIYSVSCDPDHFDASIDALLKRPDALTFVLFDGDELAGMSSYLRIDERNAVLEIGFTYYRPHLRGTGLNRRIKDMMIAQAFAAGFDVEVSSQIQRAIWYKLWGNMTMNPVSALTGTSPSTSMTTSTSPRRRQVVISSRCPSGS